MWKIFGPFFIVWVLVVALPTFWVWRGVERATGDPGLAFTGACVTLLVMHILWIRLFGRR